MYVGPEKAVIHAMAMLAITGVFQIGIIMAPYLTNRTLKCRLFVAGLMVPTLTSLVYLVFWHFNRLDFLLSNLPIPSAVWSTQLIILPLTILGYMIVMSYLLKFKIRIG